MNTGCGNDNLIASGIKQGLNGVLDDGNLSGFIDWGRAEVADGYKDLALATRSLRHNMGPRGHELASLFFQEYGMKHVDFRKIHLSSRLLVVRSHLL